MKRNSRDIIRKFDSEVSFNKKTARLFISVIEETLRKKGEAFVALSGGSTPLPIFNILNKYYSNKVDWSKVCFFWVDERTVPPSHEDSNFGNANRMLLDFLPGVKTFRLKGEYPPKKAAQEYEIYLKNMVPFEDGLPCFDLIWLGMGTDGHIASIFPDSEVIYEKKAWVKSIWVEKLGTHRLTLTFPIINNAKNRMIVMKGNEKLKIFNEIQKLKKKKYPIQYIEPSNARDYWIVGKN